MNKTQQPLSSIRREYGDIPFLEQSAHANPLQQFQVWLSEVMSSEKTLKEYDPTAMVLSTVDEHGFPDSRVVLLKAVDSQGFVFYSHYNSPKGHQMQHCSHVALNFYWPSMARQVRIRGEVEKIAQARSQAYFLSRPLSSQISALATTQSSVIENRVVLEQMVDSVKKMYQDVPMVCPDYWGGYNVKPIEMEFWQGRNDRLHDRLHYSIVQGEWRCRRLAP